MECCDCSSAVACASRSKRRSCDCAADSVSPSASMLDELDRRVAREQAVARPPDRAHAAGAELLDQLIAAKLARFANLAAHRWNIAAGSVAITAQMKFGR